MAGSCHCRCKTTNTLGAILRMTDIPCSTSQRARVPPEVCESCFSLKRKSRYGTHGTDCYPAQTRPEHSHISGDICPEHCRNGYRFGRTTLDDKPCIHASGASKSWFSSERQLNCRSWIFLEVDLSFGIARRRLDSGRTDDAWLVVPLCCQFFVFACIIRDLSGLFCALGQAVLRAAGQFGARDFWITLTTQQSCHARQ